MIRPPLVVEIACRPLVRVQRFRPLHDLVLGPLGGVFDSIGLGTRVRSPFLTDEIDDWYTRFQAKKVKIKDTLENLESIPVKAFVAYDPAGYYLEFDKFLEDLKNRRILELLR